MLVSDLVCCAVASPVWSRRRRSAAAGHRGGAAVASLATIVARVLSSPNASSASSLKRSSRGGIATAPQRVELRTEEMPTEEEFASVNVNKLEIARS